jgi:hypothetical protein
MYDLLRFRRCSDLYGNTLDVTVGKRNGKLCAFPRPTFKDPEAAPEPEEISGENLSRTLSPAPDGKSKINGERS